MISPEEIRKKATSQYTAFLRSTLARTSFFPLEIPGNKRPDKDLPVFQKEIQQLLKYAKEKIGYGYTVELRTRDTKRHGTQSLPVRIAFETAHDYLRFLKKEPEVATFNRNVKKIRVEFPILEEWLNRYPKKVIAQAENWTDILKVCHYFRENPSPNRYIRELPIKVHTKFIERNTTILTELLNILIPDHVQDSSKFQTRFNLRDKQPLVRFRLLDQDLTTDFQGFRDLAVPASDISLLRLPVQRVLIVENEYTFLALPPMRATLAIFGSGFKVSLIQNAEWLRSVEIIYWGDLDVQGFQILSQVRGYFPQTKSLMMGEKTFKKFYENDIGRPSNVKERLRFLTKEEEKIYLRLKEENLRLEQEKLPQWYVLEQLKDISV